MVNCIDWDSLEMMVGPRWRSRDPFDRERLARAKLKQRGGHKTGKNHGTGKRRARLNAEKRRLRLKAKVERERLLAVRQMAARAYWSGEVNELRI